VRNHGLTKDNNAGFFDASLWESVKRSGPAALKRLINEGLQNTSVTCVLIGSETYVRPWVRYELLKSFRRGNSLLGIHVNAISMTAQNAVDLSVVGAAHNVYLQWLLQLGVTGAVCMFAAVGLIVAATIRGVARRSTQQAIGLACIAMVAVFAVHGLVDYAFEEPSLAAMFSVILGLGYGIAERPSGGRRKR